MESLNKKLDSLSNDMNDKTKKSLSIEHLNNVLKKLDDNNITNQETLKLVHAQIDLLAQVKDSKVNAKAYHKHYRQLKTHLKDTYGYIQKGSIQSEYMSLGVAFGLLLGAALMTLNTTYLAIGLPIGVAVGLSLGSAKENTLEAKDKLY
jgi:hypothetical protein